MKLKKITFRNFASYGDRDQTIEFPEEGGFFLVQGHNGTGKTTTSDVIQFLWYGRVDGKNKKDLVNRINKSAYVRGEAVVRGRQVVVERGISPNIMELSVDGVPYDKANAKVSPSDYLETELLEIPSYVFNNAICLSIKDFKSFLKMSAKDKRLLIDRIFSFEIIFKMKETLSKLQSQVKRSIDDLTAELSATSRSYDNSLIEVDSLSKKLQENNTEKINDLSLQLSQFTQLLSLHKSKLKEFNLAYENHKAELYQITTGRAKLQQEESTIRSKLGLYKNKQCPTCTADLTADFHTTIKNELESQMSDLSVRISDLKEQESSATSVMQEYENKKRDYIQKGAKIEGRIDEINRSMKSLNNEGIDAQLESINKLVSDLKSEIKEKKAAKFEKEEKAAWFKILEQALSDKGGIKQLAMQTVVPAFNSEIYKMMGEMHLNYQVIFDDQFNAQIMHLGEEISPATLSAGETVKVDFVILMAFIRLLKMKFPSINVMFLDEIFASVDQYGIYTICKILNRIVKELGLNILVVSHHPLPSEVFEYRIDVVKNNGFSNLTVQKIK